MTLKKRKIVVFIDWYLPGFKAGGPIRSCVGLVERLSDHYDFRIITGNTDLKDDKPYPNIKTNAWNRINGNADVFYCSKSFQTFNNFRKLLIDEKPDIIYMNSMYSVNFTLLPLIAARNADIHAKLIVAPRGMLSRGALALKSFKKKSFLYIARLTGLFSRVTFHASTQIEVDEIRNVFGADTSVHLAINLTPKSKTGLQVKVKDPKIVKLIFLGRISKVKNLMQCIKLLKKTNPGNQFIYDVYGPYEDREYFELCSQEAGTSPSNVKINFKGEVSNSDINQILQHYHFMFQLTTNENFGHAMVEAFTAGCPVITSDRTPWRNLEASNSGWDLRLDDEQQIVDTLNKAATMDQNEYNIWSSGAFYYAQKINDNAKAIEDHIKMFDA